jgi:hypothetical protein
MAAGAGWPGGRPVQSAWLSGSRRVLLQRRSAERLWAGAALARVIMAP